MKGKNKKQLIELVDELNRNIRELVLNPHSFKSAVIKGQIHLDKDLENVVWFGSNIINSVPFRFSSLPYDNKELLKYRNDNRHT